MELGSTLETAVLENLAERRKTTEELVELIYLVTKEQESYPTYYMRVRRAAKKLQSRGLISAPLFGQTKPYRMTKHASEKLMAIGTRRENIPMIPTRDWALYILLAAVTGLTWVTTRMETSQNIVFSLSVAMIFLAGFASSRVVDTVRRVI
jgi:hypothetical protein